MVNHISLTIYEHYRICSHIWAPYVGIPYMIDRIWLPIYGQSYINNTVYGPIYGEPYVGIPYMVDHIWFDIATIYGLPYMLNITVYGPI